MAKSAVAVMKTVYKQKIESLISNDSIPHGNVIIRGEKGKVKDLRSTISYVLHGGGFSDRSLYGANYQELEYSIRISVTMHATHVPLHKLLDGVTDVTDGIDLIIGEISNSFFQDDFALVTAANALIGSDADFVAGIPMKQKLLPMVGVNSKFFGAGEDKYRPRHIKEAIPDQRQYLDSKIVGYVKTLTLTGWKRYIPRS